MRLPDKANSAIDLAPDPLHRLGERILRERRSRNLSQRNLGRLIGMRNDRLSRLEHGAAVPSLRETLDLARAFELSLEDFVLGVTAPPPSGEAGKPRVEPEQVVEIGRHLIVVLHLLLLSFREKGLASEEGEG